MANEEQLSILKQGATAWNKWREENSEVLKERGKAVHFRAAREIRVPKKQTART